MGHNIFQFGALYLNGKIQHIPQTPTYNGDIPQYDGEAVISIGAAKKGKDIAWVKPDGQNLLIADRVLLTKASWDDLDRNGLVRGKQIQVDGQNFRCRLLQVGKDEGGPNEWDRILDETGKDDALWHWKGMSFWGQEVSACVASSRAVRGYHSARYWSYYNATTRGVFVGFRPALEPLPSDTPTPNIKLDDIDFQLTSLPGGNFCPILQPVNKDVFSDIMVGSEVRMYTFLNNGHPIPFGEPVKDASKLTLTDRYFGDEYLIPWTISNGIAVASHLLF